MALVLLMACCFMPAAALATGLPQPDGGYAGGGIYPDGGYTGSFGGIVPDSGLSNNFGGTVPNAGSGLNNGSVPSVGGGLTNGYGGIVPDSGLSNMGGNTGSGAMISGGVSLPAIISGPSDTASAIGGVPAALRVEAYSSNGLSLGYQWYSLGGSPNGYPSPISGAVLSSYTPPQSMGTNYYCVGVYATANGMRSNEVMSGAAAVSYYGIEIARNPSKTQYSVGSSVSLNGLVVRVYEANGNYWESSNGSGLSVYPQTLGSKGSIPVQVSYGQSSATFYVNVTDGTAADDPNHEHKFGDWEVTKEATCVTTGSRTRKCECGTAETEELMKTDHTWDDGTVTKQPTNTANGATLYTCTICKANRSEIIPAGTQNPSPTTSLDAAAAGNNPANTGSGTTYANNSYVAVTPPGASSAAANASGQATLYTPQNGTSGQSQYPGQTNPGQVGTASTIDSSRGSHSEESSGWWLIPVSALLLVGTGIGAYYLMRRRGGE